MLGATHRQHVFALAIAIALAFGAVAACSSEPDRSVTAFCAQIKTVEHFNTVLESGDQQAIERQLDQLRQVQRVSPAEIETQVGLLVSVTDDVARTLATTHDPSAAANEVAHRRPEDLAAVRDAGNAVETYALTNCGVALGDRAGTSVPGSTIAGTSSTAKPSKGKASTTTTTAKPTTTTSTTPAKTTTTTTTAPKTSGTRA